MFVETLGLDHAMTNNAWFVQQEAVAIAEPQAVHTKCSAWHARCEGQMLYHLMRSKGEAGQGKGWSASPAFPSTMESPATLDLSVASTTGETSKQTNNQMPWSDTTYFIIFHSR